MILQLAAGEMAREYSGDNWLQFANDRPLSGADRGRWPGQARRARSGLDSRGAGAGHADAHRGIDAAQPTATHWATQSLAKKLGAITRSSSPAVISPAVTDSSTEAHALHQATQKDRKAACWTYEDPTRHNCMTAV